MTIDSSILYTGEVAAAVAGTIFEIAGQRTLARRRTKLCSIVREINRIRLHRSQPDQQHSGKLAGKIPRLTRGTLLKPCLSDEQPVGVDDLNVHRRGSRQCRVNVGRGIAGSRETLVLHEIELARARRVATLVVGKRALPVLVVGAITFAGNRVDKVHRQRVVGVVEERIVDGRRSARVARVRRLQEILEQGEDLRLVEDVSATVADPGTVSPVAGSFPRVGSLVRARDRLALREDCGLRHGGLDDVVDTLDSSLRARTAGTAVPIDRICKAWGKERAYDAEMVKEMHGGGLWRCVEKNFLAVRVKPQTLDNGGRERRRIDHLQL